MVDDHSGGPTHGAIAAGTREGALRGQLLRRRHGLIALAVLCALALAVLLFDWNWLRPALAHYLSSKSGRTVRIDALDISHAWTLEPTVRLRGVHIQNAAWADSRPFIVAGEVVVTTRLPSLLRGRPVITRLVLVDADIDLERQADGLRNWRLTNPDDRGPGIVKILALEPVRTRMRFIHRGIDLDVRMESSASKPPASTDVTGIYRGLSFSGNVTTGNEITFQGTRRRFPIHGHMVTRDTDLVLSGSAADVFERIDVDALVTLRGPSLAEIGPFLRKEVPETTPYRVSTHVVKEGDRWSFSDGHVAIGKTVAEGTLTIDRTDKPMRIRANVRSQSTRVEDLVWSRREQPGAAGTRANPRTTPTGDVDPRPFAAEPPESPWSRVLADLDLQLHLEIDRLTMAGVQEPARLTLEATVAHDALALSPITLWIANGSLSGSIRADALETGTTVRAQADARGIRVERLRGKSNGIAGAIDAHLDLTAHGSSLAALTRSTSGTASTSMRGGSMTSKLEAELDLSGTDYLRSLFGASNLVAIRCGVADVDFENGVGRARKLVLETGTTRIAGTGTVDLVARTVHLRLTPQGDRGFLELSKAIDIRGQPGLLKTTLIDAVRPSPERCD